MVKKILTSVLLAAVCFAPVMVAAEVVVEGAYVADGDYYNVGDLSYGYYSHELDVAVTFKADENTYLGTSFGLVDRTWADYVTAPGDKDLYENEFTLDLAWVTHVFANGLTAEAGLMPGGVWGTMLGDADDGYLRLRANQALSFGSICAYIQKNSEVGEHDISVEDGEKDDSDEVSVGMTFKAGEVTIMPMLAYTDDSSTVLDQGSDGTQTLLVDLAVSGEMGALGFEAELNYWDVSTDVAGDTDFSNINIYADFWMTMDALKAGVALAYGTEDDGQYVDFGTDFCPTELLDNDGDIYGLGAMTLAKVYGEYTVNEKLNAGCALAYAETSEDYSATVLEADDSIVELDITGAYKITDALTYYVAAAYADVDSMDDPIIYLGNEIEFSF